MSRAACPRSFDGTAGPSGSADRSAPSCARSTAKRPPGRGLLLATDLLLTLELVAVVAHRLGGIRRHAASLSMGCRAVRVALQVADDDAGRVVDRRERVGERLADRGDGLPRPLFIAEGHLVDGCLLITYGYPRTALSGA